MRPQVGTTGIPLLIVTASKTPDGCRAQDLKCNRDSVRQAISKLCRQGLIFKAVLSYCHVVYFDTPERASQCKKTAQPKKKPHVIHYRSHARQKWDESTPAIITAKTIYTIAPKPPQPTRTNTFGVYG